VELGPGESARVDAGVTTPTLPPRLDFVLLFDTTSTMTGEIAGAKSGAGAFYTDLRAESPNSMLAVASFEDYPYSTFGSSSTGDVPYRRNGDLTADATSWQAAVNSLTPHGGGDVFEAHVPALHAASTGNDLSWPGGSLAADGISFREDAAHFIALVSDGGFHNDKTGANAYSFTAPTYADALNALAADRTRVIAADSASPGPEPDMVSIAADTGGTRTTFGTDGSGLFAGQGGPSSPGILGAMRAATHPLTHEVSCGPLQASVDTGGDWSAVAGSSTRSYTLNIAAAQDITQSQLPPDGTVDCMVTVRWAGGAIAQHLTEVRVNIPQPQQAVVTPPETNLDRSPAKKTKRKTASFQFSGTPGSSFECSIDGDPFAPCVSPATYKVRLGKHSFAVRAKDGAGNLDPTPAEATWKVKKKKKRK
jgi:hypothetical protein